MDQSPRIAPGALAELGALNWVLCRLISKFAGVPDAHLFSTLARQRGLFRGWLVFASRLMPAGKLSRRDTELAILRVAHVRQCAYELHHHRKLGRRAGIDDEVFERVKIGAKAPGWTDRERALLAAVDDLLARTAFDDVSWARLRAQLDEREIIELCLLVGHYEMLATTIAALRIQPDSAQ
jgi:AhpD family alkylhydroperoxidase